MARVNGQNSASSEKTSENGSNGYLHQNGHDNNYCSHSSKRRKLHKPKAVPKCNSSSSHIEKILKSNSLENGNNSISCEKTSPKPCRRSERKTIPSSLWDNAVINPFFERKRRRLSDSPTKSKAKPVADPDSKEETEHENKNHNIISSPEPPPDKNLKSPNKEQSNMSDLDNDNLTDVEEQKLSPTEDGTAALDAQGHVRLRRSSRKHSSSVSSISDSKYTLKQEHLLKLSSNSTVDVTEVDDNDTSKIPIIDEIVSVGDNKSIDETLIPVENGACHSENEELVNKSPVVERKEEEVNKTIDETSDTDTPVSKVCTLTKNNVTSSLRKRRPKLVSPDHLENEGNNLENPESDKKDKIKSESDDDIKIPLQNSEHVKGCDQEYKSFDNEIDIKVPPQDSSSETPQKETYVRRGRKQSVRYRHKRKYQRKEEGTTPSKSLDEGTISKTESPMKTETPIRTETTIKPETPTKSVSPENEITVSKEALLTKEAMSLIDGSSFQRFYKMRTRRQNSSAEEAPNKEGVKKDAADARRSSRSNSGNSKHSDPGSGTATTAAGSGTAGTTPSTPSTGEVKKRTKRVKPDILCSFCLQTTEERREDMISCFLCGASGHPSCLQFDAALTARVKLYDWECIECKKCELCRKPGDDATLLFCDDCDKGFHMGCLSLSGEPSGHWSCLYCVEGSTYWANRIRTTVDEKQTRKKKSDKISKRKQLLDDLAMFHEAQSRAQTVMAEETKNQPKLKTPKRKADGKVPPTIKSIEFGCYEIKTWYTSPYPAEYALQSKLYICEFCLKYMKSGVIATRHTAKCPARCPPGDEIYRKDTISVFEVDGRKNKTYCQNLCLLAKLFLDHKTLYYDVEPFLFYMLTEYDKKGCHIVGYFSKEKNSFLCYNVSCILVLPPYMKKGYGKMLIDFSYALSRREGKLGSPEKPLSDLGLISYRNYWKEKLLEYFLTYKDTEITIKGISTTLGFNPYDIVSTLQAYGMIKYHKSNHYVLKRPEMLGAFKRKQATHAGLPSRTIDMGCLKWTPHTQRKPPT